MKRYKFNRTFTKGIFAGMTIVDDCTFLDDADFADWIIGVNRNHAKGKLDSFVTRIAG